VRAAESALVGFALLIVVAGAALGVLTAPWFTRTLVTRLDIATSASLPPATAADAAESVRAFVTRRDAPALPAEVAGRPGFDAAAVSHLADVRDVLLSVRLLAVLAAVALTVWVIVGVSRKRCDRLVSGFRTGAILCVALPVAAGIAGAVDFGRFFSAFHGVFFDPGTWVFPEDSLLIGLFPEPFWMVSGVVLGVALVLSGLVLAVVSVGIRRTCGSDARRPNSAGT
jgi:integral membrane protein (TIGR01906 family)